MREEVARYDAAPLAVFEGPVMPEGAEPAEGGFAMGRSRRIDWERQADCAIEAFGRARAGLDDQLVGGNILMDPTTATCASLRPATDAPATSSCRSTTTQC